VKAETVAAAIRARSFLIGNLPALLV